MLLSFLSCVATVCFSRANPQLARSQLLQGVLIKCLPHIVLSPMFSTHRVRIKAGGGCYTEEDRPLTHTHTRHGTGSVRGQERERQEGKLGESTLGLYNMGGRGQGHRGSEEK